MDLGLKDATEVVVGGGRGMGFAAARCLAEDGARVAVVGRTKDVLQALKRLAGVEQAHPCFGRPDIIMFITVGDERALSDVVITKIHQVEGVEETDTHIVADT